MNSQTTTENEEPEKPTYLVPPPVAASLSSGRALFTKQFAKEVREGKVKLKPQEASEVLRLVADLIEDNYKLKTRHEEFHSAVQTQVSEKLVQIVNDVVHLRTDMQELVKDFKP